MSRLWFQQKLGIIYLRRLVRYKFLMAEAGFQWFPSVAEFTSSRRFDLMVAALILANAVSTGIAEFYPPKADMPPALGVMDNIFCAVFLLEWTLRILGTGWIWIFLENMNTFDTFFIWVFGVLITYFLEPAGYNVRWVRSLTTLRILRLSRFVKRVRMITLFHELWLLVSGIMSCARLVLWSTVINFAIIYMFAVAVLELLTKARELENNGEVQVYFGDLPWTMFSLFGLMTFAGWAAMCRPIIAALPITGGILVFIYLGIGSIVLFNLMAAVVINRTLEITEADTEMVVRENLLKNVAVQEEVLEIFRDLDEDGSGTISWEEFSNVKSDPLFVRKMKELEIDKDDFEIVFTILVKGQVEILAQDFVVGLKRLQGVAMNRDAKKAISLGKKLNTHLYDLEEEVGETVPVVLDRVEEEMKHVITCVEQLQCLTADILRDLGEIGLRRVLQDTQKAVLPHVPEPTLEQIKKKIGKRGEQPRTKPPDMEGYDILPMTFVAEQRLAKRKEEKAEIKKKLKKESRARMGLQSLQSKALKSSQKAPEETFRGGEVRLAFGQTWDELKVRIPTFTVEPTDLRALANGTQEAGADPPEPGLVGAPTAHIAQAHNTMPNCMPVTLAPRSLQPVVLQKTQKIFLPGEPQHEEEERKETAQKFLESII